MKEMNMKKVYALFMYSQLMLLSFSVFANCDINGKCTYDCSPDSSNLTCTAILENGTLIISGTGAMKDYKYEGSSQNWHVVDVPWKDQIDQIENVVIAGEITSIGNGTFTGCDSLKNVVLSSNVKRIGRFSFIESNLENINLENVTAIEDAAFCRTNLSEVMLSDKLEKISWQVFDSTNLVSLSIPDSVTSIGWAAFAGLPYTKVYCNNINGRCDKIFSDTDTYLPTDNIINYTIESDRYVYKGLRYRTLEDIQKNRPVKRIYTIQEATAVSKPTGNIFRLRYK